ncbi:MAG TPA: CsbD family protein [Anaeromyxobacteraceae bacterium]
MAMGDDDKLEGKWDQAKGRVKNAAGEITGNRDLKEEGTMDKLKGKMKEVKGAIKGAVDPDKHERHEP